MARRNEIRTPSASEEATSARRHERTRLLPAPCSLLPALATALLTAAPLLAQAPPDHVALVNGRIIPIVGQPIEKGTVLIERNAIVAVGEDVEVPFDAKVFDLADKVVMPGLINVHTSDGLDVANESRPVTPQLNVYDAIDPSQLVFENALRLGVTAMHILPGNNTVIGGVGRLVHPIGMTVPEMTIAEEAFLKISVAPRSGYDRMAQLATIRETFVRHAESLANLAEKRYEEQLEKQDKTIDVGPEEARRRGLKELQAEDIGEEDRNLLRLTGGVVRIDDAESEPLFTPLGAFVYCEEAMDVAPAIRIAEEHGFFDRLVLVLGGECYKAVDELKQAARPVVLPEQLVYSETDPLTGEIQETFVPKVIADAGLLFAIVPGPEKSLPERMLTYQAARCVREGVARDEALRAITINPARIVGQEQRLGSIEPGKIANLVVYSGDPLDFDSVVEMVFIDGVPAYERSRDPRIQRLLSAEEEVSAPAPESEPQAPASGPAGESSAEQEDENSE